MKKIILFLLLTSFIFADLTFDLKTAGSNEKLTTNVDLSNMQLK